MAAYIVSGQFSQDGKYFTYLTADGKLKIWETATSTFKQEFTPDLHLSTPCVCLHWIQGKSQSQWKKRKRRSSEPSVTQAEESTYLIALGTTSGILLLYSVAAAQVEATVDSNTSSPISCITWNSTQEVYAAAEEHVLVFDLKDKCVKTKWKAGTEKISAVLLVPHKSRLITATKTIKLWDLKSKNVIRTYTGHSSNVVLLKYIPSDNSDYFLSGSKNDRLLNCWSLNEQSREKTAVASLLMEDVAYSASLAEGSDSTTNLAAVTRSGIVHVYQHTLNGKYGKPVKPKFTIQVAANTSVSKDIVTPIPIVGAHFHKDTTIMIAHGNYIILTFENIVPSSYEKVQCLIRKNPQELLVTRQKEVTKTKETVIDKDVMYLTPYTSANNVRQKRKGSDAKTEMPMEQRLENLTLNKQGAGVPKQTNVAQLLIQGLHSKDKKILHQALSKTDDSIISTTVKRLPMQTVIPLITELSTLIQGKTVSSHMAACWLKHVLQYHGSQLISNPDLAELFQPILNTIQHRLSLFTPLARLRGRLDLLISQISDTSANDDETEEALLVYKDGGTSESESEDNLELNLHSESENEWVDEEDKDANDNSNSDENENNVLDSDMST